MFGFKKLFSKNGETSNAAVADAPAETSATAAPSPTSDQAAATPAGNMISITLQGIVNRMSDTLKQEVAGSIPADAAIQMPVASVAKQLSKGRVSITFGNLKKLTSPRHFSNNGSQDATLVDLPLQEIIPQLKNGGFGRKQQKRVVVPDEVEAVFPTSEKPVAPISAPAKSDTEQPTPAPAAETPAPAPAPAPAPTPAPVKMPAPPAAPQAPKAPAAPKMPAVTASKSPERPSIKPAAIPKGNRPAPIDLDTDLDEIPNIFGSPSPAKAEKPEAAAPAPDPTEEAEDAPVNRLAMAKPKDTPASKPEGISLPTPARPAMKPTPAASDENASKRIPIRLNIIFTNWPEPIQEQVLNLENPDGAVVEFPFNEIEQAIQRGKICYSWKQIREWIKPAQEAAVTEEDETMLNIPLKSVVPVFLELKKPAAKRQAAAELEEIPEVFNVAGPEPEEVSAKVPDPKAGPELATVSTADLPPIEPIAKSPEEDLVSDISLPKPAELKKPSAPPVPSRPNPVATPKIPSLPGKPTLPKADSAGSPSKPDISPDTSDLDAIPGPFSMSPAKAESPKPEEPKTEVGKPAAEESLEPVPAKAEPVRQTSAPVTLGRVFMQPDKANWTIQEIVDKTCLLLGVSGAAIAMDDGLLVAGKLPSHLDEETVAAFLPRLFTRVNETCSAMELSTPAKMVIYSDDVPVAFIKTGKSIFMVSGHKGEDLPMRQIDCIAKNLGKNSK